jgi:serine/threonine protein phosphatase PrpC
MRIRIEVRCHPGTVRPENQDALLVDGQILRADLREHDIADGDRNCPLLFAVADGMGGHADGARASVLACTALGACASRLSTDVSYAQMQHEIAAALETLHRSMRENCARHNVAWAMGTTVTALAISSSGAALVHAGDSRAYRLRDGILIRLTRDHTIREMVDPSAAANLLANSVGGGEHMFLDMEDYSGRLIPGDRFLLCSDGLCRTVDDDEIEVLLGAGQLSHAADGLLKTALARAAPDNVSLLIASIGEVEGIQNPLGNPESNAADGVEVAS